MRGVMDLTIYPCLSVQKFYYLKSENFISSSHQNWMSVLYYSRWSTQQLAMIKNVLPWSSFIGSFKINYSEEKANPAIFDQNVQLINTQEW